MPCITYKLLQPTIQSELIQTELLNYTFDLTAKFDIELHLPLLQTRVVQNGDMGTYIQSLQYTISMSAKNSNWVTQTSPINACKACQMV